MKKSIITLIFLAILLICPIKIMAEPGVYTDVTNGINQEDDSSISIDGYVDSVENTDEMNKLYNNLNELTNNNEFLRDMNIKEYMRNASKTGSDKTLLDKMNKKVSDMFIKELKIALNSMILIILVAIITSLIHNLQLTVSSNGIADIAYYACFAIIASLISVSFSIGVELVQRTITDVTNFIKVITPVCVSMLLASGAVAEAATFSPIILGTIGICIYIYKYIIIPLILTSFVLNFVNAISSQHRLDRFTDLVSKSVIVIQGFMLTIFIGVITIRGITSTTIDQVTVKTVKFAMDKFIPVVGGCLSDAIATVAGYSILIKNSISVFGLIIVILLILSPIIKLFIIASLYKIAAAIIQPISDKRLVNLLDKSGNSLMLLMSSLVSIGIMFFIMSAIILSSGKAILGGG